MSRARAALALVTVVLLLAPIFLAGIPPLSDYVNHLARAHVLAHLGENAAYQSAYAAAWGPYPNLAFDLVVVPLAHVLDVVTAGKIFLALTILVWCSGCHMLGHATLGRLSFRATAACFFVMCEPFLLGYANFTFGVGVALWATACLVRARNVDPARRWIAAAAALGLVAAVSHAAAAITFGIIVASFAAASLLEGRRLGAAVRDAAAGVPCGAYFLVWLALFADRGADKSWASPGTSARVLVESILPSYVPRADKPILAALAIAAAAWLVLSRPLKVERPFAIAAALCALAVFIAPADFAGSYEANGRYALGAWALLLFAVRGVELNPRRAAAVAAIGFAALGARQLLVTRAWIDLSRELAETREVLRAVPEGAVVANVTFLNAKAPRSDRLRELALLHAPALAAIDRSAVVPTLYAIRGVQPLAHKRSLYDGHRFKLGDTERVDTARLAFEADVVWLVRAPDEIVARLGRTRALGGSGEGVLVAIER